MPMPVQGRGAPPGPPSTTPLHGSPGPAPALQAPACTGCLSASLPLCRSAAPRCAAPRAGGPRAAPSTRAHAAPRTCVCTAHVERCAWSGEAEGDARGNAAHACAREAGESMHRAARGFASTHARTGVGSTERCRAHACASIHLRVHACACIHSCVSAHTYVHPFTCVCAHACASVRLPPRVCSHACARDHLYVRADAHTRGHAPTRVCSLTRMGVHRVCVCSHVCALSPHSPALTHTCPRSHPRVSAPRTAPRATSPRGCHPAAGTPLAAWGRRDPPSPPRSPGATVPSSARWHWGHLGTR